MSDRGLNGSLRGSLCRAPTSRNVKSRGSERAPVSGAQGFSVCGRTANQYVNSSGGFGSSRERTPTGITYVSGVGQQVLLQRAAHPHEPPLRPDPVGQVAHGDSAAPVAPVAAVDRSTAWLSRLSLPVFSPPLCLCDAAIPPTTPCIADTLAGTSHS